MELRIILLWLLSLLLLFIIGSRLRYTISRTDSTIILEPIRFSKVDILPNSINSYQQDNDSLITRNSLLKDLNRIKDKALYLNYEDRRIIYQELGYLESAIPSNGPLEIRK